MCIAIVKPAGKWVSHESLSNSFVANPHGAGYAFLKDGVMVIKKGFFDFKKFFKSYSKDVDVNTVAMIHFRIATKGAKDEANCHPFAIDNGALMHNGPCINYTRCNGDKERSDTRQFAEDFVKTLNRDQIIAIRPMIESFAGTEKIAFLFNDGEYVIANEKEGLWSEGCWYSNTSFRGYFNASGRSYRQDDWTGGNQSGPYGGSYGRGIGTSGTTGGASGPQAPKDLEMIVKRSFGVGVPLFDCKWSLILKTYVPQKIVLDGTTPMTWDDIYGAYIPDDVVNNMCSDKRYVYEATDEAAKRIGGPSVKVDTDWVICGDCLTTEHDLRVFLRDARPATIIVPPTDTKPAETPNPGVQPGQEGIKTSVLTTEVASAASPVVDASTTKTSETVH